MSMTTTEELIIYSNSRNGLGIRILGGKRASSKSGIYIRQILDDGLADRDRRLKVGDQILSINEQLAIGISREHAINVLRSAASTNQVRLRVRHYFPPTSSTEYQKFLQDEKSTDEEGENGQRADLNQTRLNKTNPHENTAFNELQVRRSSRRNRDSDNPQKRHTTYQYPLDKTQDEHRNKRTDPDSRQDIVESLIHSEFRSVDLVDLLKRRFPQKFPNEKKEELKFIKQLTEARPDGRISLRDFERQASVFLGERVNLLSYFAPSNNEFATSNNDQTIVELRQELATCQSTIQDLQGKIVTCERSQRLAQEVELEYEDLLKFLYEQLNQLKLNETNQIKHLRANDQLIQKLFSQLLTYVSEPNQEQTLAQLKFEYEQQSKYLSNLGQHNSNNKTKYSSTNKY